MTRRPPALPSGAALPAHDAASVREHWERLHACDALPLPTDERLLDAWTLYHQGDFLQAAEAGIAIGNAPGLAVANKAIAIHATYLEADEAARLALLMEVATRATELTTRAPDDPCAWYWQAYALGRYSQGISIARALAQGMAPRVRAALEKTLLLQPRHADAHLALGMFHAEVIDKVGALIGGMTYGARKDQGLRLLAEGLRLNPHSIIGRIEYANGLVMLEGEDRVPEATRLYEQAATSTPLDATEWLEVALARAELED
ncbi:MAG: hypothetical protein J0H69_17865 [Burkholderiales bacterium]|nr:hypothetical protein [Burkholderiales bacterium]